MFQLYMVANPEDRFSYNETHILLAQPMEIPCVDPEGGQGFGPPEKSQNIGLLSNTGPDLLKNHKAVGPFIGTPAKRRIRILNTFFLILPVLYGIKPRPYFERVRFPPKVLIHTFVSD